MYNPSMESAKDDPVRFSELRPFILEAPDRVRVARQIVAVLDDHLQPTGLAGRRVLDVGCSSGIITSYLADFTGPIVGIDVDAEAVRLANQQSHREHLTFQVMDGSTLDFPSESFDIVVCNQVYMWLKPPDGLMAEIHRVLRPGGSCYFACVNKYTLWENQYRLPFLSFLPPRLADVYVRATGRGERFDCRYLSYWELRRLCRKFVVHSYTARVLKDPMKFRFANLEKVKAVTNAIPLRWLEALEPISPNLIWLLDKPRLR